MEQQDHPIKIKRALLSVSDKSGILDLAKCLIQESIEIISTGGTGKLLSENQIPFTPIEKVTGNPESFQGRMKTLSFQIMSALLFNRKSPSDWEEAKLLKISPIDLVVCNLYPFQKAAQENSKESNYQEKLIENIDIGGPSLLRASAKNMDSVTVCTDPQDYPILINMIQTSKGHSLLSIRKQLALKAFQLTASYDAFISKTFENLFQGQEKTIHIPCSSQDKLRYGENPHQEAWKVPMVLKETLLTTKPLQGKEMSYNNYLDSDSALRCCSDLLREFPLKKSVVVVKHLNPCGACVSNQQIDALEKAWDGDSTSSFGSILCFSHEVTLSESKWLQDKFIEVLIAPSYTAEALELFKKKKNIRLLKIPISYDSKSPMVRSVDGGYLLQTEDGEIQENFTNKTETPFPQDQFDLAKFGVIIVKHLRSNAIVVVGEHEKSFMIMGAGMGNPNRLISHEQAFKKMNEKKYFNPEKSVLVSDAFFPFSDNIDIANEAKIRALVQPGGSIQDDSVIARCNELKIAMLTTGKRHFRH